MDESVGRDLLSFVEELIFSQYDTTTERLSHLKRYTLSHPETP